MNKEELVRDLNTKILEITTIIKAQHPELLCFVDNMPTTVQSRNSIDFFISNLRFYHESLVLLLKKHKFDHSNTYQDSNVNFADENCNPNTNYLKMEYNNDKITDCFVKAEYIEVMPNVSLHITDAGKGRPIVLIHGWPLSDEMFEYQYKALMTKNFRVIGICLRVLGSRINLMELMIMMFMLRILKLYWTNWVLRMPFY